MNADRIKKLRKEFGLTQQGIADELGVSINTIQNWEAGGVIPQTKQKLIDTFIELRSVVKPIEKVNTNINAENALSFLVASNIRTEAAIEALTEIIAELRSSNEKKKKTFSEVVGEISITKAKIASMLFQTI